MITIESRALYYTLRKSWEKNPDFEVEKWQVTDYQELDEPTLYEEVAVFAPALDSEQFLRYASMFDSPEDMALFFAEDHEDEPKKVDRFYCALFELWKRNVHDRVCVSIFCDKLDRLIDDYHIELEIDTALIDVCIDELLMLLKDYSDGLESKEEVFQALAQGCANDLEGFLIEYFSEQLDEGRREYVREWIDALVDFIDDKNFFTLLYSRSFITSDPIHARSILEQLVNRLSPVDDTDLYSEALDVAIEGGYTALVEDIAIEILSSTNSEEDISDLIESLQEFAEEVEYTALVDSMIQFKALLDKEGVSKKLITSIIESIRSEFDKQHPQR